MDTITITSNGKEITMSTSVFVLKFEDYLMEEKNIQSDSAIGTCRYLDELIENLFLS